MDPEKNKALVRGIPPPPVFDSAPSIHASIPIPSFSSAPDFSTKNSQEERKSRHDRSSPSESSRSRHHSPSTSTVHRSSTRRHRSRSPSRRHRSRSPSRRHRSRSPSSSYHSSSRRRSRSPSGRSSGHSRRHEKSSHRKRSPEIVHTGTLNTGISFVMDRRGDSDNLRYGGNHIYSIPEYRRRGGGRIIGLPFNKRIDNSVIKAGQVSIIDKSDKKPSRYMDSNYSWKELDKSLKRIRIKPKKNISDPFASHTNTITFDDNYGKRAIDNESYASSGVDYRSLEGNKVKRIKEEYDTEDEQEEGESFNDQIRQRTIDFNRQLDQEPENVKLWLDFIHFQDEAAAGLDPSATTNKSNKSSLNEVKLSIFEKALDYNPMDEELIYEYLTCGAETWETLKLLREWDEMLKQHPDSIRLWAEYINLRQTNFASFSYTNCVQVFEDALSTLKRQAKKCSKEEDDERREDIESLMIYILLRACLFIKQSGYQEKAFAIIQAAVEFNLYQPVNFTMDQRQSEEKVNAFVEFWDSEVLRFGEEGALGWHEYFRATDNGEEIPDVEFDKPATADEDDDNEVLSLKDWFVSELENEQKNHMPLRMNQAEDDSVDEDPYRIILSDDLKSFLFNITTKGARQSLIYSIFVFMGLPYTPPHVGTNTHFFTDTFTHNEMPLNNFWPANQNATKHLVWYVAGVPMNPEETASEMNPYYIPSSYPVGLNELFAKSGNWFKCAGKEYIQCDIDEKFIRTVFQQLLTIEKSEHLTICYLAFESSCGQKLGRRLAKTLLKDQRTSLTLWNAYAQMEKSHDRIDEARKVYLTALSMYHTFPENDQRNAPVLYYMFAKLEMENNRPHEALKILTSMSNDNQSYNDQTPPPTSTLILKTREYFSQKLAQLSTLSHSQSERQIAINMIGCSALFEYLSSGLDSACLVYQHALDYIKERQAERGYESEIIWIDYATLLYKHATTSTSYKPGLLRQAMEYALVLFPNNTMFLGFYIWNESKTKIYNRVQHLLNDAVKKDSNVILWLSAIYSELHKYTPYHVNSVRDYFDRSTQDIRTKSSILLWKCYIQFELLQENMQKARSLFYRSVRECPWSKELYMLGIKSFGENMDEKEANELISLMMEKEIRLRIPIDDDLLT